MGRKKVVTQPVYLAGRPQQQALTTVAFLQEALLPALYHIYTPGLEPIARERTKQTAEELTRQLGISTPISIPTGEETLERFRGIAQEIYNPLETALQQAEQEIAKRREMLTELTTQPMENPYTQTVIDAMQRRLREETARGMEQLATTFELAGVAKSSAFPEQARLLSERSQMFLQENISKLLFDVFERQRATQLEAIRMLSAMPLQEVEIGKIRSQIASMPYDIVPQVFSNIGAIQSGLLQGTGVGQQVQQSGLSSFLQGFGTLVGSLATGALTLGSLGLLGGATPALPSIGTTLTGGTGGYYLGFKPGL